jgi:hypothetical protein
LLLLCGFSHTVAVTAAAAAAAAAAMHLYMQLMMYDDNRYEVESKYTQFISLTSRPVWPRLDMAPLAAVLNQLEARYSSSSNSGGGGGAAQQQQQQQQQQQAGGLWRTNSGSSTGTPVSMARGGALQQQQQQQQQQQHQGLGGSAAAAAAAAGGQGLASQGVAAPAAPGSLRWVANSLTDTGVCVLECVLRVKYEKEG